jgi:hypothetical protein
MIYWLGVEELQYGAVELQTTNRNISPGLVQFAKNVIFSPSETLAIMLTLVIISGGA